MKTTFKTITTVIFVLASFVFAGCCNPGSEPGAPYGTPDDVTRYDGSNGYKSVDYTYYCLNGEYVSVNYVRIDACSDYQEQSIFRTGGICD